ncbi:1-deoxy-D-xylulose-5-phosphate synthase [bacterium C-53]|nr:1-deoxy-D-xylulose-5-phosphate synthase [Lachnospiraceae bacterium]NBI04669.1 1-deoxy-D-xylulose-5-phosphate synthase [Lachnospiraceae bacterium]RKJ07892.1 1-deoxy-D-xylulose-5-phosphate synthase [bacterium C-53]
MLLEKINQANDIKKIAPADYNKLAQEIRDFLIEKISKTGGHLGSNLGAIELTMAMHLALNFPQDKIVWDVGHQSYTHKILTGRRDGFDGLRKFGGMSGFPKRKESNCDAFDTGHSSTSISAGLGLVKARDLKGENHTVISVIGDGALTGGMAYEALNNAARLRTNFIIILNDNNMSISENVGGISKYLRSIRTADNYREFKVNLEKLLLKMPKYGGTVVDTLKRYKSSFKQLVVPGMLFEDMGITYLGPVDGHDIKAVSKLVRDAKKIDHAVIIHVITKKGKGFGPAERHPARFHGAEPFDLETGLPLKSRIKANYTDVFATVINKIAAKDDKVVAITAAMPDGTGLKRFRNMYPDRFFDVGIAEEHAVTFAAGLAAGGLKPVVAIYSSFLQRAYDQILHDVCIQNLPVVFAIDRAGLVGSDGETHQGLFDLSFLSSIPNMHIMAPKNKWELADMLRFAVDLGLPVAVRYPRGEAYDGLKEFREPIEYGRSEVLYAESGIVLFAVGSMVKTAVKVREELKGKGYACSIVNARFVKPIDEEAVCVAAENHKLLVTMEENVLSGGYGERVRDFVDRNKIQIKVVNVALPDEYVEHGNVDILKREVGIDKDSITEKILTEMQSERKIRRPFGKAWIK